MSDLPGESTLEGGGGVPVRPILRHVRCSGMTCPNCELLMELFNMASYSIEDVIDSPLTTQLSLFFCLPL